MANYVKLVADLQHDLFMLINENISGGSLGGGCSAVRPCFGHRNPGIVAHLVCAITTGVIDYIRLIYILNDE